MRNARMTICLVVAVLVMATGQGFGWTQFKDGGTHNIDYTINDDVWVDYLAPGMQTTVNLLNGGAILYPYKLQGYNDSRTNISGGSVGSFYVWDNSQVTISGGEVQSYLYASDNSQVTISDGSGGFFFASDSTHVTMSGGGMSQLNASDSTHVTMSGGSVNDVFRASGSSQVTMSGGTIGDYSYGIGLSQLAILIIDGSNFAIDGTPVGLGEIKSILGGSYSNDPFRRLTGTLANGDILNNRFQIGESASIVLVPEPATLLLLGLGVPIISGLRRKR